MLRQVRTVVPRHFFVIVLADRGLYARWLFQRIVRLGWHPVLRINTGGTFRPGKSVHSQPLREFVPPPGTQWVGVGTAFRGPRRRLNCTLLARWDEGYRDPWLVLTDLAPSAGEACWYGLRAWIEQGFKITKRGGWQLSCLMSEIHAKCNMIATSKSGNGSTRLPWGIRTAMMLTGCGMTRSSRVFAVALPRLKASPRSRPCHG